MELKHFRWIPIIAGAALTAWFAVYAVLVLAGQMKPWATSGPYYHLWYALYGSTRTWGCHLLAVLLSSYVLTPCVRTRWVVVNLSTVVGLAVVWVLVMLEHGEYVYLGATSYWRVNVSQVVEVSVLLEFPIDYFFGALIAWIFPIAVAWITVKSRGRSATRPRDVTRVEVPP